MRDTRTAAIYAHVQKAMKHTGIEQEDFADDVVTMYQARTPLHAINIKFHKHVVGSNPYVVLRANAQLVFRMLKPDGAVRMPVEIEEAVVLSLPQPFRDECLAELSARYGLLAAPLPTRTDAPMHEQIKSGCELMRKGATAVERISPMFENGEIGPEDHRHFPDAIHSLNDVIGCCTTLLAQIAEAIRATPAPPPGANETIGPRPQGRGH